jgi:DNA-binding SARP family transcriptional activator
MIRAKFLGSFSLESEGVALEPPARKVVALMAYLVAHAGQALSRDKLATLLWEDSGPEQARSSLRHALLALRKALGRDLLVSNGASVSLSTRGVEIDVLAFQELARRNVADDLARASELYGGEFLTDFGPVSRSFDEWLQLERARLATLAADVLARTATLRAAAGELDVAIDCGRRLVALDPFREDAHRLLMQLYASAGRRAEAIRQYTTCVDILRRELGIEPDAQTSALAHRIREQEQRASPMAGIDDDARRPADFGGMPAKTAAEAPVGAASASPHDTAASDLQVTDASSPAHRGPRAPLVSRLCMSRRVALAVSCIAALIVVAGLVRALKPPVPDSATKPPITAQVADLLWQADQLWGRHRSRATVVDVRELLERAIALDANNLNANARLADILTAALHNGWSNDRNNDLAVAERAFARVLQQDRNHYTALMARCQWYRAKFLFADALAVCKDVLAHYPKSVWALKEIGYDQIYLGFAEDALETFAEAERLEPNSPQRWAWLQGQGFANLLLARDAQAIELLRVAVEEPLGTGRSYAWLAAAYALSGHDEAAREALRQFRRIWPAVTLSSTYFQTRSSPRLAEQMQRVLQGLRLAGLPE